jgi:hypothetical protein
VENDLYPGPILMWLATYLRAVRLAATNRHLPLAHILLSPLVPYMKYAAPVLFMWTTFKVLALDSMYVRILAEGEAQASSKARESSKTEN